MLMVILMTYITYIIIKRGPNNSNIEVKLAPSRGEVTRCVGFGAVHYVLFLDS